MDIYIPMKIKMPTMINFLRLEVDTRGDVAVDIGSLESGDWDDFKNQYMEALDEHYFKRRGDWHEKKEATREVAEIDYSERERDGSTK